MTGGEIVTVLLAGAVSAELVLDYLIGICPVIAMSRKTDTALGLAVAQVLVAPATVCVGHVLVYGLLAPLGLGILRLPVLVLTLVACIYLVGGALRRVWPAGHGWLEPFLPLMSVNCSLLGIALLAILPQGGLLAAVVTGTGLALGFGVLLVVFSYLQDRLATSVLPAAFRDGPIALVTLGIMALACSGFGG